ncbi:MAG: PAS domain S-box protein [Nitrospirae bacterium]|nr:MAG: PAS domain S-box protein [Nitrospirota bacterium]
MRVDRLKRIAESIPLTYKMAVISVMVGMAVWWVFDYLHSSRQKRMFEAFMTERLLLQDRQARTRFDNHVAEYHEALKIAVSHKSFLAYLTTPAFAKPPSPRTLEHNKLPVWLPAASPIRNLAPITYAVLTNSSGTAREIYNNSQGPVPQALLSLHETNASQRLIANIDNKPFIIVSESIRSPKGTKLAHLVFAVPINSDFPGVLEGNPSDIVTALATADSQLLIASSRPGEIPPGVSTKELEKNYIMTGGPLPDREQSGLTLRFLTLMSKKEYEGLGASLRHKDRIQRAATALAIIICLTFITVRITRKISKMTLEIASACEKKFGAKPMTHGRGDELKILEEQFHNFIYEIGGARELLKEQAEMMLREKTVYLDNILHSSPLAIAATDINFVIKYYNPVAARLFGYTADEVIGKTVMEIHTKEKVEHSRFEKAIEIVKRENLYIYNVKVRTDEGFRFLESRVSGIWDKSGELVGFVLMSNDITERHLAENELMKIRYAIDSSSDAVAMADLDKRHIFQNRAFSDLFEYTVEELNAAGGPESTFKSPEVAAEVFTSVLQGHPWTGECDMVAKTGRVFSTRLRADAIKDSHGKIVGLLGVFTDITEQKRIEDNIKSVARFPAENPSPVLRVSKSGTLIYANAASSPILKLWGCREGEPLPEGWRNMVSDVLSRQVTREIDVECDGRVFSVILTPLGSSNDVNLYGRDITGRVQIEKELRQKQAELAEFNRTLEDRVAEEVIKNIEQGQMMIIQSRQAAMGEMIGNIAHQWRQPLNTLGLMIQDLRHAQKYGELDETYLAKSVEEGMGLVKLMSQTIDDFRNFFTPNKEKELFSPLRNIRKTISFVEASFRNHNIAVNLDAAHDEDIEGFPNEYSQALLTILNNAKDALLEQKPQAPRIDIRLIFENGRSVVTVFDNAGGIKEGIIDKIFDPYFTTKEQGKGTGIGLYIAKTIIEKNMGGRLSARALKDGIEFRIEV